VKRGWHVVVVGLYAIDPSFDAFDLTNKTSVNQLAALMKQSALFIGGDSLPMHVALAMDCPTVAIFGVTSSRFVTHPNAHSVFLDADPSIPSAGLRHRIDSVEHIPEGKDAIESHSVEDVKKAAERLGVL
jgi:ADP-heptose:LPS heptosyltransferase